MECAEAHETIQVGEAILTLSRLMNSLNRSKSLLDYLFEVSFLGNDVCNIVCADALYVQASCEYYLGIRVTDGVSREVHS
jgi:hypothetical protein